MHGMAEQARFICELMSESAFSTCNTGSPKKLKIMKTLHAIMGPNHENHAGRVRNVPMMALN